jgi:predicted aldo/keto reductase-like oxidoreductase
MLLSIIVDHSSVALRRLGIMAVQPLTNLACVEIHPFWHLSVRSLATACLMLHRSLKRLQTDHLDLWQVHGVTF